MKLFVKERLETLKPALIILSACKGEDQNIDSNNTNLLSSLLELNNVKFSKVQGCYKGTCETSFLCIVSSPAEARLISSFADMFNQESILLRTSNGIYLLFNNGDEPFKIGDNFKNVPAHVAKRQDAYTVKDGKYYIVK